MINISNLTLKYPSGKGVFDLNFEIKQGEVMGYLGPNGAGKTTTIRCLMGFMKTDKGAATINGLDCFKNASKIQESLGYIPGEISFIEGVSGYEYLNFISKARGLKDDVRKNELLDMFEISPKGNIKRFSKGMKQKLGIISAFMHDPEILILDEPTSGLDPLMQSRFIELITSEKKKGKTILMSSHIFEEIERTCDNVLIIKNGRIITQSDIATLKSSQRKGFIISANNIENTSALLKEKGFELTVINNSIEVFVTAENINNFIKTLSQVNVTDFDAKPQTLEDIFMYYYKMEEN